MPSSTRRIRLNSKCTTRSDPFRSGLATARIPLDAGRFYVGNILFPLTLKEAILRADGSGLARWWMTLRQFVGAAWIAALGLGASPTMAQDGAAGEAVFQQQCSLCHSAKPGENRTGPSLFDIVDQPAGRVPGFTYSAGNTQSGMVWTRAALDLYLISPHRAVPGNAMPYGGLQDAGRRADVIAFLATLH